MFIQRIILTVAAGVAISVSAAPAKPNSASPPKLLPGLGEVHHPVATKNSQAQQFFDQGLKLVFGFNHDEARKSFQRAAELDPKLAMAWWGVSLTLGPNYNLPVDPEREKAGYDAAQRAVALKPNASEAERGTFGKISSGRRSSGAHARPHLRACRRPFCIGALQPGRYCGGQEISGRDPGAGRLPHAVLQPQPSLSRVCLLHEWQFCRSE